MADAPYQGDEAWDDPDHTDLWSFDGTLFKFDAAEDDDSGLDDKVSIA